MRAGRIACRVCVAQSVTLELGPPAKMVLPAAKPGAETFEVQYPMSWSLAALSGLTQNVYAAQLMAWSGYRDRDGPDPVFLAPNPGLITHPRRDPCFPPPSTTSGII